MIIFVKPPSEIDFQNHELFCKSMEKFLSSNERKSVRKHSKAKEFCTFTTENHIYCSRYHDCKYCNLQPKPVQNG